MNPDARAKLKVLFEKIESLDYFQILRVTDQSSPAEIKARFYAEAERFHPDNFYMDDPDIKKEITTIYKRISEAYSILSDPDRRARYITLLKQNRESNLRYSLEKEEEHRRSMEKAQSDPGQTAAGNKYYKMALVALAEGKPQSAQMQIALALKHEPTNASFLELKLRTDHDIAEKKRQQASQNPFEIGKKQISS